MSRRHTTRLALQTALAAASTARRAHTATSDEAVRFLQAQARSLIAKACAKLAQAVRLEQRQTKDRRAA